MRCRKLISARGICYLQLKCATISSSHALSLCCRNSLQADANRRQEPVHALHAGGGGVSQHNAAATRSATATPPAPTTTAATAATAESTAGHSTTASPADADEPESGVGDRGEQVGPRGASAGAGGDAQDDRSQAEEDLGHLEGRKKLRNEGGKVKTRALIAARAKIVILSSISISRFICAAIASRAQFTHRILECASYLIPGRQAGWGPRRSGESLWDRFPGPFL